MTSVADIAVPSVPEVSLSVAPDLIIRRSLQHSHCLQLAWGSGSSREEFETDSSELAAWLISLPCPAAASDLAAVAASHLGLDANDAEELVLALVRHGLLAGDHPDPPAAEHAWTKLEWWDALTFHRSIRGMRWRHEYPEGAEVFTWFHHDKLVAPDTPPPEVLDEISDEEIDLPGPSFHVDKADFLETLRSRRTSRGFSGTTITMEHISDLLHWSFRPIIPMAERRHFTTRSSVDSYRDFEPEALTVYAVFDASKLPPALAGRGAIYRYSPKRHTLIPVEKDDRNFGYFSDLLWGQSFADGAPLMLVLAVNWPLYMWKYRYSTFYRMVHFDLGAFMQTLLLVAAALHLRTFITPAIDDERFGELLGTDSSVREPAYIVAIGGSKTNA